MEHIKHKKEQKEKEEQEKLDDVRFPSAINFYCIAHSKAKTILFSGST